MVSTPSATVFIRSLCAKLKILSRTIRSFSSSQLRLKSDLSILSTSAGTSFTNCNDESPLPKSSIATVKPAFLIEMIQPSSLSSLPTIADSVISTSSRGWGSSYLSTRAVSLSAKSSSSMCLREKFTEIGNCGIRFCLTSVLQANSVTYQSISIMRSDSSATGMKWKGDITVPSGFIQRTSASAPLRRFVNVSYCG